MTYEFDEGEIRFSVESERCAASGVGVSWVGHGGELSAGEVVPVHRDEGCEGGSDGLAVEGALGAVEAEDDG